MKAYELMIGDWVEVPNDEVKAKVTAPISFLCGTPSIDVNYETYDEDMVEPIPLTEEILKENGFEDKPEMARYGSVFYGLFIGNISISFEVDNGLPILTIEDTSDRSNQHNIICLKDEIYNVHELQRALRCCGLFDIANNFKV